MIATLSPDLRRTVEEVKAAHQDALAVRKRISSRIHERRLAALHLVLTYKHKVQPTLRSGNIDRSVWNKSILPNSPVPSLLHTWSEEEAEAILVESGAEISDLDVAEEQSRDVRRKGLYTLFTAQVDGQPLLSQADIAALTDVSEALVGKDLDIAAEEAADPAPEAGNLAPIQQLAERLHVTVKEIRDWFEYAKENGIELPPTSRGTGRGLHIDVEAAAAWWKENHFDWLSAQQLADRYGMPYSRLKQRLEAARKRGEEPEKVVFGPRLIRYNPKAADRWHSY